jgi:hypothetical protein
MRHLVTLLTLFPLFGLLVVTSSHEAFGYTIVLYQHSTQETHNVVRGAGGENGVFTLEPGMTNRRGMGGRQRRAYRARLAADQFLKAVIEQDGIDVVAHLSGQDCEQIMDFDTESRLRGQESVRQGAEHPNIAESLNRLAGLRSNTGDYAKDAESQYESVGEKLISEGEALIESHLVKCNHCRGVIKFAAESESKGLLSLYLIPADNKRNYYRIANTSSLSENILVCDANSPI